jgi:signal peptidase I
MMDLDFSALLVLAVFVTGVLWALDALLWEPKRRRAALALEQPGGIYDKATREEAQEKILKEPLLIEYSRSLFPVLLIVLILRAFIVEPFRIPSGSMMPTLLAGDFILVNKFSYGLRLPVINTKVVELGEPQRGDVVVFRYPVDPSTDYIKRVIALPGDHVSYVNKQLIINGEPVRQTAAGSYVGVGSGVAMTGAQVWDEQLFEVNHQILIEPHKGTFERMEFDVPEGSYFVMGDNRDNSNDSRYWGFVPEQNLVGKAFMIWMYWDSKAGGVAWSRLGSTIE